MHFTYIALGVLVLGGIVGYAAETLKITNTGKFLAVVIGVGGAAITFFVTNLFGISLASQGMLACFGAAVALYFAPDRS